MSSSSSLAAARRRRAGGAGSNPTPTRPTPPSGPNNQQQIRVPPNAQVNQSPQVPPFIMLKQHEAKLNVIQEAIHRIQENNGVNNPNPTLSSSSDKFDINELTELLMTQLEDKLDLKAFYENDQKLASEIESLHTMVESQQSIINSLNTTLHFIIQNLNLTHPSDSDANSMIIDNFTEKPEELSSENEENVGDESVDYLPTFTTHSTNIEQEKSVVINEDINEIKEFTNDDDDDGSNFTPLNSDEPKTLDGNGLFIEPVD
jgi:hypothetical protein